MVGSLEWKMVVLWVLSMVVRKVQLLVELMGEMKVVKKEKKRVA